MYTNIYFDVIQIKDIQRIMIYHNVSKCESNFELKYWVFQVSEKIITIKIVFVENKNSVIFGIKLRLNWKTFKAFFAMKLKGRFLSEKKDASINNLECKYDWLVGFLLRCLLLYLDDIWIEILYETLFLQLKIWFYLLKIKIY